MALFDKFAEPHLVSIAESLKRIADILEMNQTGRGGVSFRTGYSDTKPDESYISYHSDEQAFHKEQERYNYTSRTGRPLRDDEEVPNHGG